MKINFLEEPELEFGKSQAHIDVRFGISEYGPFDFGTPTAPTRIRIGIVGTQETVEGIQIWLERAESGIPAKESRLPNLFPPFPGFSDSSCFEASLVYHGRWISSIHRGEIENLVASSPIENLVYDAVDLFLDHASDLAQPGGPTVIICAPPTELLSALETDVSGRPDQLDAEIDEGSEFRGDRKSRPYFHDLLKAQGMRLNVPIQMVRPETYGGKKQSRKRKAPFSVDSLQDEATRAWNFHTALYYKAGGIPWRLIRDPSQLSSCFVGVSFFRALEGDRLLTSVAQVFNERGEGIIVKGGDAQVDKEDRQPHLSAEDANNLLKNALQTYRREHQTFPARAVIHKTSAMTEGEVEGFDAAAKDERIDILDLLTLRRSFTRLFREDTYPPLRGTWLQLDNRRGLLYLRGSVDFFKTYPGLYVPRPLEFVVEEAETTQRQLAEELFSLSKLNWNNTQFDGGEPITVRAARRVGDILKCVLEGRDIQSSFRFFM